MYFNSSYISSFDLDSDFGACVDLDLVLGAASVLVVSFCAGGFAFFLPLRPEIKPKYH